MGSDSRIGKRFLFAGVGYGGSCFPKDVLALCSTSKEYEYDFKILNSVVEVNQIQRERFFKSILDHFEGDLKGKKFGMWGLAFKPNTDDIREAPAVYLIKKFLEHGAELSVYDQEAMANVKEIYGDDIKFNDEPYACLPDADALIVVTEWTEFRTPDFDKMKATMKNPIIFDGRNIYDVGVPESHGFDYYSIGRPQSVEATHNMS